MDKNTSNLKKSIEKKIKKKLLQVDIIAFEKIITAPCIEVTGIRKDEPGFPCMGKYIVFNVSEEGFLMYKHQDSEACIWFEKKHSRWQIGYMNGNGEELCILYKKSKRKYKDRYLYDGKWKLMTDGEICSCKTVSVKMYISGL